MSKDLTLEEALVVVETLKRRSYENLIEAVEQEGQGSNEDTGVKIMFYVRMWASVCGYERMCGSGNVWGIHVYVEVNYENWIDIKLF